jgi:hypothetical protein
MDTDARRAWINESLDTVFEALAASRALRSMLVFKGARVLHRRLGAASRQSFDIDSNLAQSFVDQHRARTDQQHIIETEVIRALQSHLHAQAVVRFEVQKITVKLRPQRDHHLGWNAFVVAIRLIDRTRPGVLGLPTLEIDIAAPENLGPGAIGPLLVGSNETAAYTLERITAEKLRAFLSSLPAYRKKAAKAGDVVRAKDIYDLASITAARPLSDGSFWSNVRSEFRLACESRYIDCDGLSTFEEHLDVTEATYKADATLPKDITFSEAWAALRSVVQLFEHAGLFPLRFAIPERHPSST